MALSRIDRVHLSFQTEAEILHNKFLSIRSDANCSGCRSAGFGEAILATELQTRWTEFMRSLVIASALGTRRTRGTSVRAIAGIRSEADAERIVKKATSCALKKRRINSPVWHAPWFVIEIGALVGVRNLPKLTAVLGPTLTPEQITDFRNYLVHPGYRTRYKYDALQAKLGMNNIEPQDLLHQQQKPGLPVFTSWVRELQSIAYDSTQ